MPRLNFTALLEKSVLDLIQFNKSDSVIDEILKIVFETILKAEQDGFLGYHENNRLNKKHPNKRNGYYPSRLLKGISSHFRVQVPRDRMGFFKPMFLELAKNQNEKINELAFKLYAKGLSTSEIGEVVHEIYGKSLSKQSVSNITNNFKSHSMDWLNKPLDEQYYCLYIDALRIPIRRDTVENEAFYIILGLKKDLTREILGVYLLPEESKDGWCEILKNIKKRGVKNTLLVITDEFKEIEEAILTSFPNADIQRCITHKKRNILKKVRLKDKKAIMADFDHVLNMTDHNYDLKSALKRLKNFQIKWSRIYPSIGRMFQRKEEYFTYLKFPWIMRRMIYTNNWIENINRLIKRTTKIRASFPNPDSAVKLVMIKCIEIEERLLKYPVTSLLECQYELNEMLYSKKGGCLQTHES